MRLGYFETTHHFITDINTWGILCKEIYPIDIKYTFNRTCEVIALSELFDDVKETEMTPHYEIMITTNEDKSHTIKANKL